MELKLTGGPLADAANNPILVMAPEACRGRLTLNQGGNAVALGNGQWPIVFGENAEDADDNEESERCTLQGVAPTATPPPYRVASDANEITWQDLWFSLCGSCC